MNARKQQHTNGVKGNRDIDKIDLVTKHKPSKVQLNDPRRVEVSLMLSHPKQSVQPLTIELWELERVKKKYEDMGFSITIVN